MFLGPGNRVPGKYNFLEIQELKKYRLFYMVFEEKKFMEQRNQNKSETKCQPSALYSRIVIKANIRNIEAVLFC